MPQKCHIVNCTAPVIAQGLCSTHYKRKQRHNSVENTRPIDWGQREKHPAYSSWCNLKRSHLKSIPLAWVNDFWAFVADVPEKPNKAGVSRIDPKSLWDKNNFFWKEARSASDERKQYAREWHRKSRAADPDYYRNRHLKKTYGVDLDWYNAKLEEQGGACAICKKPETAIIHGNAIRLSVDHCHNTGKVRGLLCRACNNALGMLGHDCGILASAISYLESLQPGKPVYLTAPG